jgi:hypothetical protein
MKKTPAERLGSGDGERKTLLTRQIAFEPLPASVLFAIVPVCGMREHQLLLLGCFTAAKPRTGRDAKTLPALVDSVNPENFG